MVHVPYRSVAALCQPLTTHDLVLHPLVSYSLSALSCTIISYPMHLLHIPDKELEPRMNVILGFLGKIGKKIWWCCSMNNVIRSKPSDNEEDRENEPCPLKASSHPPSSPKAPYPKFIGLPWVPCQQLCCCRECPKTPTKPLEGLPFTSKLPDGAGW